MSCYKSFVLALMLISVSAVGLGQQERGTKSGLPAKSTFVVIYKPGPTWLPGKPLKEQPLQEHGRYILSLYAKGMLKFGGPFSDDAGGAAVFEAADESEAKAIVTRDPAVVSQVFVYELHPWKLVDWESLLKK